MLSIIITIINYCNCFFNYFSIINIYLYYVCMYVITEVKYVLLKLYH